MIVKKSSNDICATCYKYHMWQKGDGMFCHGIEREEEKEEDNDSDYKSDFDHEDDWDQEELVINSEEEEEFKDDDNNMDEDDDGYTVSECAYMNVINTLEDNDSVEMVEEEEEQKQQQEQEKDERYYLRENKGLENVSVINKLRLHINEARSMRQEARIAVGQAKEDTDNKVPVEHMGSSARTPDFQSLCARSFLLAKISKIVSVVLTFLAERTNFSHYNRQILVL